jgi:hypothetical protein
MENEKKTNKLDKEDNIRIRSFISFEKKKKKMECLNYPGILYLNLYSSAIIIS